MKTSYLKMDGKLIIDAHVSIEGVLHLVQNKFVKCTPALNHSAWNVTEAKTYCPICFPDAINPVQLKLF